MTSRAQSKALAQECVRQHENCLYTAAAFTEWLKSLRRLRHAEVCLSLILGSFATWELVASSKVPAVEYAAAGAAFLAGLLPAVFSALKFDDQIEAARRLSGVFTNLRDGFRRAATVYSKLDFPEFEARFNELMEQMNTARAEGVTTPQRFFQLAQARIKKGDFAFDVDAERGDGVGGTGTTAP